MPCEKTVVGLKPVNFFTGIPGIDVKKEGGRKSVLVE
jgi:Cu2+-containing amine oxidase